jgi:hypothetical protein
VHHGAHCEAIENLGGLSVHAEAVQQHADEYGHGAENRHATHDDGREWMVPLISGQRGDVASLGRKVCDSWANLDDGIGSYHRHWQEVAGGGCASVPIFFHHYFARDAHRDCDRFAFEKPQNADEERIRDCIEIANRHHQQNDHWVEDALVAADAKFLCFDFHNFDAFNLHVQKCHVESLRIAFQVRIRVNHDVWHCDVLLVGVLDQLHIVVAINFVHAVNVHHHLLYGDDDEFGIVVAIAVGDRDSLIVEYPD